MNKNKKSKNNFFLISGPCVIESETMALEIAFKMKNICDQLNIDYFFKASFAISVVVIFRP